MDDDGVVRRGLLFLDDGENFSISFSLRLALLYLADEGITPQAGEPNPEHIRLGPVTFTPFEKSDAVYINADARGYQQAQNDENQTVRHPFHACSPRIRQNDRPRAGH